MVIMVVHVRSLWVVGVILMVISRVVAEKTGYGKGCNNTTQGPHKCKCPCAESRITKCFFVNRHDPLCKCKEGHQGVYCDNCKNGWYRSGNFSNPASVCLPCNCSGNLDLSKPASCHPKTGKCLKCLPQVTGKHCERCAKGYHGDAVITKNCTLCGVNLANSQGTKHINKEVIIISTCVVLGVVFLVAIGYLIYIRHRDSFSKRKIPKFWTVEILNRNYDDLDFSLLDPVADTPFVYRNDANDFEEALITNEGSKAQLRIDLDTLTEEFEDTSF